MRVRRHGSGSAVILPKITDASIIQLKCPGIALGLKIAAQCVYIYIYNYNSNENDMLAWPSVKANDLENEAARDTMIFRVYL